MISAEIKFYKRVPVFEAFNVCDAIEHAANDAELHKQLPEFIEKHMEREQIGFCSIAVTPDGFLHKMEISDKNNRAAENIIKVLWDSLFWKKHFVRLYGNPADGNTYVFNLYQLEVRLSPYETYEHHGAMMHVKSDLKGKHREHCLCYQCDRFAPDSLNNCHKAQELFDLCVDGDMVAPVWECSDFELEEE